MVLKTRQRGGRMFAGLFGGPQLPGVLTASEFEAIFHRECALVYRNPHSFSLVVFVSKDKDEGELRRLASILSQRVRTGDAVGQLDRSRIVSLLPFTDGKSAWQFADDLVRRLAEEGLSFDCVVYTFPPAEDDAPNLRESAKREEEQEGEDLTEDVEPDEVESPTGHEAPERKPEPAFAMSKSEPSTLADVRADSERPIEDMTDLMVIQTPLHKRLIDICGSLVALVLLTPVMMIVAALVKLSSPGPIIFTQLRAGAAGHAFPFYKFRSMYIDAEERKKDLADQNERDGPVFKIRNDPRVTPIGRFIRRYSLDELPQLYNVLKGDMTLVGPRPATMDEVPAYETWQRQRLNLKGGITCTWQVSGRSDVSFEDWMRMDARYVEQQSLLTDLGLLARTAKAVVSGRGAY
ncbi:MAG: lipopolysaccharide/colanic/teichoic acid biosynthesis glycosyltransferase [Planctomycetota bacterium]|jgi:lipopolysaccharide/colanic/teichoic acid biosynthesis glycosyltransferase